MNKFTSRKFLVLLWAIGLITYIVVAGKEEMTSIATILSAAPLAYFGANAYVHKINKD